MLKKLGCILVIGLLAVGFLGGVTQAKDTRTPVIKKSPTPTTMYTTHAPIRINNDADFTLQFSNRTIWGLDINGTDRGFCIFIGNCSLPFTVKDCYLHESRMKSIPGYFFYTNYFSNSGLNVYKSFNGSILNNRCYRNSNYGIDICNSDHNTISNNICMKNEQGIYVQYSDNNLIKDEKNSENTNAGIYLYKSNINSIGNSNCSFNSEYGIYLSYSTSNTISNNSCFNNTCTGIYLSYSNTNTIEYNDCDVNRNSGMHLEYSDTNTIVNNNCLGSCNGIQLGSSDKNKIMNNNCYRDIGMGIWIGSSNMNNLSNNFCEALGGGIILSYSFSNILNKNSMIGCGIIIDGLFLSHFVSHQINITNTINGKPIWYLKNQTGVLIPKDVGQIIVVNCIKITIDKHKIANCTVCILAAYSSDCIFSNNTLCGDSSWALYDWGIKLYYTNHSNIVNNAVNGHCMGTYLYSSNNNNIKNNNCSKNDEGIYMRNSCTNTITNNNMCNNLGCGVLLWEKSFSNRFYYNRFISNHDGKKQASDGSGNNFWNTSGTPHGYGNNWSDWRYPDANRDGIVDNPYLIDGGTDAKDYYPLTIPGTMPPPTNDNTSIILIACTLVISLVVVSIAVYIWRKRKSTPNIPIQIQDSNKPQ